MPVSSTPPRHPGAAPLWLRVMRRYDGLPELLNGQLNPIVRDFFRFTKFPKNQINKKTSWCAAMVTECLEVSGVRSARSAAAIAYENYGVPCDPGEIGAILVFGRNDPQNPNARHVALSEGYVPGSNGKLVLVRGGNQGNKCCVVERKVSELTASRYPDLG